MSVHVDPLRNTLDRLALDPKAKDDRRYLVSMLRRLGYSDAEIEDALGPVEGKRVIEVEYGAKGHVGGLHVEPVQEESTFSVVQADEPTFQEVDDDWEAEWGDDPETLEADEADEAEDDDATVTFLERVPEEETTAWPEEDDDWLADDGQDSDDADTDDAPVAFTIARGQVGQVPPAERSDDTGGWLLDDADDWTPRTVEGDPAVEHGWQPADEDTEDWKVDKAPGDSWEPTQESDVEWTDETDPELEDTPETEWLDEEGSVEAVQEAEAAVDEMDEPFRYEDYTLHTRMVELSTGRDQRIYFFAKGEPKSGTPCPLPDGYIVEQNDRTGLPFLRRDLNGRATPQPVVAEVDDDDGDVDATPQDDGTELVDLAKCHAVTKSGSQCKRGPREGSKYCATHKGWRGDKVA